MTGAAAAGAASSAALTRPAARPAGVRIFIGWSHPFPRGLIGLGRREVSWLPGPTLRRLPGSRCETSGCGLGPRAVGFPGDSGGSAPDSHRLPCPPTVNGAHAIPRTTGDRQPHAHLHPARRRRRDASRRHEPGPQDAPADRGVRDRRRAQRADRRGADRGRPAGAVRGLAHPRAERPVRRRRRHLGPARRRPRAAAGGPGADGMARAGVRRGERRAAEPEVVRTARRHRRRRAAARVPHGLPARRAADDRVRRGSQRGVRALPQPPLRPPVHPRARGQRGHGDGEPLWEPGRYR